MYRALKRFAPVALVLLFAVATHMSCARQNAVGLKKAPEPRTLGYFQIKSAYAKAAYEEGKLEGIRKVFENKHSKTGKPYPCWNALKPFRGKDMPVSLSILSPSGSTAGDFFTISKLDVKKFDLKGKDGQFSSERPAKRNDHTIWRMDNIYTKSQQDRFPKEVVGLVDISGSMGVSKKLNTIRGLAQSNIKFKDLYTFSERDSLNETKAGELLKALPTGRTALYDNLIALSKKYPGEEILVVTDGKDNKSETKFGELIEFFSKTDQKVDVVLTGSRVADKFFEVASKTGGQMLNDFNESGYILEPRLEVYVEE